MNIKHNTALAAQVAAWNRANAEANRLSVQLAEIFKPFVGKKITCNGGSLTVKCKAAVPILSCVPALHIWQSASNYALHYVVRTCEVHNGGARYAETWVCVGSVKDHVLENVNEPCTDRRTNYIEAEVIALREAVKRAERALRDAESALSPFGRYDH